MENNNNFMNYPIVIKFSGTVMDFDEHLCNCEWDIPSYLNERVINLLSRFFQISGIKEGDNKFYFNDESIEKYNSYFLSQINLSNNPNIQIGYIEKDDNNAINFLANENNNILKNNAIYIKFIKLNNYPVYNFNSELKGILKLCILKEFADKINLPDIGIWKLGGLPEIVYFILKILKYGYNYQYDYDNPSPNIKELLQKEKGCNIINFSNFVDEQFKISILQNIMKTIYVNNINDMNDSYCRLGKYDLYISFFENDIIKALKQSVFEFSIVSLVILDSENFDEFENEKAKCPDRCDKILYHGTQIHPVSSFLNELLKKQKILIINVEKEFI